MAIIFEKLMFLIRKGYVLVPYGEMEFAMYSGEIRYHKSVG